MNREMYDAAAWFLKHAKSAGADGCRVSICSDRRVEVSYRERNPENIKEAKRKYLTVDVFADGRYSNQTTSDLRPAAVKDFISNAVVTTKMLAEDAFRSLPDPKYYKGRAETDIEVFDQSHEKFSPDDRHEIVKAIEASCLDKGGDKVISVTASCCDTAIEAAVLASNGFEGYQRLTHYTAGASMTAQGAGDRRPSADNYMTSMQRSGLPSPSTIGVGAAERTLELVGATKIKTETLPIIVESRNVPRLLYGFLAGMYGSSIQQKRSFLADKKGQRIGSDHFTLIDDPLIKGGLGSQLFDNDGMAAKTRTMVNKGVLNEFWVDWYYSRKLGWEPTSGRPANVVIPPGTRSVEEIMKDLGRGILITGFIGGNSNSTTGDTSVGILGQLFDEGKTVQPVSEMNIADNHLKFWQKLAEVGNDPWLYSSFRTPSLVFTDVVVSGA